MNGFSAESPEPKLKSEGNLREEKLKDNEKEEVDLL